MRVVPMPRFVVLYCAVLLVVGVVMLIPHSTAGATPPLCDGLPATISGTPGDDVLVGTDGDDVIAGRGGDDVIDGLGGDDIICGGKGDDHLVGGAGDDKTGGYLGDDIHELSLIHISEPTRLGMLSRMPSSA